MSARTSRKLLRRLGLQCSRCGWDDGTGDIHHIHGRKVHDPNNHKNLAYICPNCHRLVHEGKVLTAELTSLERQLPANWWERYFG